LPLLLALSTAALAWDALAYVKYGEFTVFGLSAALMVLAFWGSVLPAKAGKNSAPYFNAAAAALFVLLAASVFGLQSGVNTAPRYVDEEIWLQYAHFYKLYFLDADFGNPDWKTVYAYDSPLVGPYVFGFALDWANGKVVNNLVGAEKWHRWLKSRSGGNTYLGDINPPDYPVGRRVSFLFAVVSATLLAALVSRHLNGALAGLAAATLFLRSGVAFPTFQQVMVDSMCATLSLCALFGLIRLSARLPGWPASGGDWRGTIRQAGSALPHALLAGLLVGLAVSTKFLTANVAATAAAFLLMWASSDAFRGWRGGCLSRGFRAASVKVVALCALAFAALATYVILHPCVWDDPAGLLGRNLTYRLRWIHGASTMPFGVDSMGERLGFLYSDGLLFGWSIPAPLQAALVCLAGAGLLAMLAHSRKEAAAGFFGPYTVMLTWSVVTYAVNGPLVPTVWARYYIPFAEVSAVLCGVGAKALADALARRLPGGGG
jgi:hypothetical protein